MSAEAADLQSQCLTCQFHHNNEEVCATFISTDWRTPFLEYLLKGIFPPNPKDVYRLKRLAMRYFVEGGTLFRKGFHGEPLRCLSLPESQMVIRETHARECGEHQGKKRLYQCLLTLGYYWPKMKKDAADFVKTCHTWLDLIGPINPASGGYIWILMATKYFTKWVEAIPLRKATGSARILPSQASTLHTLLPSRKWASRGYKQDAVTDLNPCVMRGSELEVGANMCAEARMANLEGLDEARELARARSQMNYQKMANVYSKALRVRVFMEGQMILKAAEFVRRSLPSPSKFSPNWDGPYII
uniref:Integrase zinc-binding domain-containing protein n=1 Tax=Fagus sylvatica TaxID=28930 RepID=A0A2N9GXZ0_FAGSY